MMLLLQLSFGLDHVTVFGRDTRSMPRTTVLAVKPALGQWYLWVNSRSQRCPSPSIGSAYVEKRELYDYSNGCHACWLVAILIRKMRSISIQRIEGEWFYTYMNQEMLEAFIFKAEERFATISLVERGIRSGEGLSVATVRKLAKAFEITVDALINQETSESQREPAGRALVTT